MEDILIRRFKPQDEDAVRQVCFDTAFQGRPAGLWMDINQAFFTDLWLLYYLRETPSLVYVAEYQGQIIGYVTGCLDVAARERYYRVRFPFVLLKGLCQGRYRFGMRTLRVVMRHIRDGLVHGRPKIEIEPPWAEFHCNVQEPFRGPRYKCGFLLTRFFFGDMKYAGLTRLRAGAVVRQQEVEGRYRMIAKSYDTRPTTIYSAVDAGLYVLVDGYMDFSDPGMPVWWKRFWSAAKQLPGWDEVGKSAC